MTDTVDKLMPAQGNLRVAAIKVSMQTVANFNECKINVLFNFINYFGG